MITTVYSTARYERRRRRILIRLGKAMIDYRNALQKAGDMLWKTSSSPCLNAVLCDAGGET